MQTIDLVVNKALPRKLTLDELILFFLTTNYGNP